MERALSKQIMEQEDVESQPLIVPERKDTLTIPESSQGKEATGSTGGLHGEEDSNAPVGEQEPGHTGSEALFQAAARAMYFSHFLSRWGDRMWEFAVALFMLEVWKDSLLLTAIYGLVEAGCVALLGVLIGDLVDAHPRLKVVSCSILVQNASIIGAGLAVVLLLHEQAPSGVPFFALVVLITALGGIQALAGLAGNISVEKDWVVVVAGLSADRSRALSSLNSVMRRIDLSCLLLAPILVGLLMSAVSVPAAAVLIAAWNLFSMAGEYYGLHWVFSRVPALAVKPPPKPKGGEPAGKAEGEGEASSLSEQVRGWLRGVVKVGSKVLGGWETYMHQEVLLPALALALLYLTVLSFGTLMTAVLHWRGVPAWLLSVARGVGAASGLSATVLYPQLHHHIHSLRTGLRAIWLQLACLVPCVASVWVTSNLAAAWLLIIGVVCSRLGLWMFDLSVTQLMQESVPEGERGVVGGVQNATQELMHMLSFVIAILVPAPKDFGLLVVLSFCMVQSAAVLYTVHCYMVRGHLFHLHKIKDLAGTLPFARKTATAAELSCNRLRQRALPVGR